MVSRRVTIAMRCGSNALRIERIYFYFIASALMRGLSFS